MKLLVLRRIASVAAAIAVVAALGVGVAAASLTSRPAASIGVAAASVQTMSPPTASAIGDDIAVTFSTGTLSDGRLVERYDLRRTSGATTTVLSCPTSPCADTNLAAGTYTYAVRSIYRQWQGPWSAESPAVTIAAETNLTITSVFRNGGNKKVAFTGTGGTPGAAITMTICQTNSFPCSGTTWTASGTVGSNGNWTTGQSGPSNLAPSATYWARAVQTSPSKTSALFQFSTAGL